MKELPGPARQEGLSKMAIGLKRGFWTVLQAILAFTLASTSLHAEDLKKLLGGLDEVRIGVAELDEDAKTCGLTEELIKNTTALTLKENTPIKIIEGNSADKADIYVRISTTYIPKIDLCLSGIDLTVRKLVDVKDKENAVTGLVAIWDASNLSSGKRDGYPIWFQKSLSDGLNQLASDWFLQNYIH
jgi:hypothetical protein